MKVLLVDDHTLVRRGIGHVVQDSFSDAEIFEAADAAEAMAILSAEQIDIALLDVRLADGGPDGIELLHDLRAEHPVLPAIMLTTFDHANFARRALTEGASGYMLKDSDPTDLAQAMRVALSGGGNVMSPQVITNLFEEARDPQPTSERGQTPHPERQSADLTPREIDILELVTQGMSNRDVAAQLTLSEKTVKAHLAAIFRKLGVANRTQAAMAGLAMGIGGPSTVRQAAPQAGAPL